MRIIIKTNNLKEHMAMKSIAITALLIVILQIPSFAANLTSCGTLSTANTTYVLQNNVTANGTCFTVAANNVVLDLNGKTVTYDNATPISVTNGSFESELSGNWDVTGAANATRAAGAYLTPSVYVGSYALKVTTPTANQQVQSVGTVKLQPNTRYSLSGMVYNKVADAVQMSIGFEGTAIAATQTARTWRGFQYIYTQFTTGGSEVSYKINLNVTGASGVASGSVYFDDIRVQQSANHGVKAGDTVGPVWARNPTIKNGIITQGQAHGDFSHAISMVALIPSDNPGGEVSGVTMSVSGNSSKAIVTNGQFSNGLIYNNTMNSSVDTIRTRDYYDGALIYIQDPSTNTSIYNNTITSGIQTGIYVRSRDALNRVKIYGNDITLQSKYTNDFAIVGYGEYGSDIYNNVVRCGSGNNTCRGIYMSSNGGTIHNNTIDVHYRTNNQEYSGCGGSAYGIQIEEMAVGIEVYENTVTANADECGAAAFRHYGPTPSSPAANNYVHDNTFKAVVVNNSDKIAATVQILESFAQHLNFTRNILNTNSCWLYIDGLQVEDDNNRSLTLDGNTFQLSLPKASTFQPLIDATWFNGSYPPRNVTLSNNIYADATVASDMGNAQFVSRYRGYEVDPYIYNVVISNPITYPAPIIQIIIKK